ncbi:MAG: hypothetical protein M3381_08180 [Actinomycetota bacterium]|nr:hypothetical protein [Actinomycetota bacterium]
MRSRRTIIALVLSLIAAFGTTFLVPVSSSSPMSTAEAALRKSVTSDYTLLRRGPRSYVIGTAYRGWTVDVQGNADSGYRWGRVFGDLNGCLWIYEGAVVGSGPATQSCSSTPQIWPTGLFTNGQIGGGSDDGASVATVAGTGCATYDGVHLLGWGNVRPWQDMTRATAPVPTSLTFGATVRWRYVSRDGAFVMVRDPAAGSTDGVGIQAWYFLPRGCLPATLP